MVFTALKKKRKQKQNKKAERLLLPFPVGGSLLLGAPQGPGWLASPVPAIQTKERGKESEHGGHCSLSHSVTAKVHLAAALAPDGRNETSGRGSPRKCCSASPPAPGPHGMRAPGTQPPCSEATQSTRRRSVSRCGHRRRSELIRDGGGTAMRKV